jgi:2-polyprenyl-3-methyl-5-hydroxy-6-metoxy-1,4-benzoquinol methylase
MRALRSMTPTRADYFASVLRVRIADRDVGPILDIGCGGESVRLKAANGLLSARAFRF